MIRVYTGTSTTNSQVKNTVEFLNENNIPFEAIEQDIPASITLENPVLRTLPLVELPDGTRWAGYQPHLLRELCHEPDVLDQSTQTQVEPTGDQGDLPAPD